MVRIQLRKQLHAATGRLDLEVDLKIPDGAFVAVSGPSGGGKTTLLRLIAGLERPEQGVVQTAGETWLDTSRRLFVPPQKRKLGLVFQDYALFPNMTVEQNLFYALEKGQDKSGVQELIQITGLTELAKRYPVNLSGGQQQRLALARALVRKPSILLLDEPLSALDSAMRSKLQDYIQSLHQAFRLTTILVSHDFEEIKKLAETVFWLEEGKITRSGRPIDVFHEINPQETTVLEGVVLEILSEDDPVKALVEIGTNTVEIVLDEDQKNHFQKNKRVKLRWSKAGLELAPF